MENNKQESVKLLNVLIRFKNAFFQMWALVLVLAVIGGAYYWYAAKRSFVPMYESKAIFTVDSSYDAEDIFGTGTYYDQFAAQQLASAFPHLISTDMMLDLVYQELDERTPTASPPLRQWRTAICWCSPWWAAMRRTLTITCAPL